MSWRPGKCSWSVHSDVTMASAIARICSTERASIMWVGIEVWLPSRYIASVASSAASVSLSGRSARIKGCFRARSTAAALPIKMPACGPPSSLSPENVTRSAPLAIAEAVASGADLVTFSGDKLLGGPQAGILIGKAAAVERARKHPLMRALRPDKLTLAALEATLAMYRDGNHTSIPTHMMLARSVEQMRAMADAIVTSLCTDQEHLPGRQDIAIEPCVSAVGGGAMPTAELPSVAITLPERYEPSLRGYGTAVIGRVADGRVWLDLRTVADEELFELIAAVQSCVMSPV